jgi:hypothetical protein
MKIQKKFAGRTLSDNETPARRVLFASVNKAAATVLSFSSVT